MIRVKEPTEFVWDRGNKDKNWVEHKVTNEEGEETFLDKNKKIYKDKLHSNKEERYILIGKTKGQRLLYLVFTLRDKKARVISARDINRKERRLYEKST